MNHLRFDRKDLTDSRELDYDNTRENTSALFCILRLKPT